VSRAAAFEQFNRSQEIRPPSGRLFGIALAVPFAVLGGVRALRGGQVRWWAAGIAAALVLMAMVRPAMLDPLAAAWTRLLRPLHSAITILVMGLLFYLVMTPVGWLRRALVRDPLRLHFDPRARTYWRERQAPDPRSMVNQF
jgi:hypothetical protein